MCAREGGSKIKRPVRAGQNETTHLDEMLGVGDDPLALDALNGGLHHRVAEERVLACKGGRALAMVRRYSWRACYERPTAVGYARDVKAGTKLAVRSLG